MKIAVVGAGISGLGAAWALGRRNDIVLYEAAESLGGHANTVEACVDGKRIPVDTGFIVYNEHNYPNLTRLFAALGVNTVRSDMSFSVSLDAGRLEYAGSAAGLVAQPGNLLRPGYWRMLRDLVQFYKEAPGLLGRLGREEPSLGDLLKDGGYSRVFAAWHLLPMAAAIWSTPVSGVLDFPARTFIDFFENHGLFSLGARPQWRSVRGGSREYVRALTAGFADRIRLGTPVVGLRREATGVMLRDAAGEETRFDQVVLATHGDQALEILGEAVSPMERQVLSRFRYHENRAVLHRDPDFMPRRRRVWTSWNYLAASGEDLGGQAAVTYWMNRLQRLETRADLFITLNPLRPPAVDAVLGTYAYRHPHFDRAAIEAQRALPEIQGADRVWFCGSYCGYGFHEDGLQAGLGVASALGSPAPWAGEVVPKSPAARAVRPVIPSLAAE